MKTKMKLLIMIFMSVFIVAGCGEKEELETIPQVSLDEIINMDEEVDNEECPEGYVYDYQVSMEPIPEEIAALGGEVCGTIHAYPTEIEAALLKKEIDSDEELQEENKRNIEGIRQYLEKIYGGEFEIVPIQKEVWIYKCREMDTEKEFTIKVRPSYTKGVSDDVVAVSTYDYEDVVEEYKDGIKNIIQTVGMSEAMHRIRRQTVNEVDSLDLYIAAFSEVKPDYIEEQKKIIEIFNVLKKYQKDEKDGIYLNIIVTYFPMEYKEVIAAQYQSNCFADIQRINVNSILELCVNDEVYAQFRYMGTTDEEDADSLDRLIENIDNYYVFYQVLLYL